MLEKAKILLSKNSGSHMQEIMRKGSVAFALKIAGAALMFVFHVVIARLLGASGSGIYFLALTIITFSAALARYGMDDCITKYVANFSSVNNWPATKKTLHFATKLTLIASAIITAIIYLSSGFIATTIFNKNELEVPLQNLALATPAYALMMIYARAHQGIKNVRESMLLQNVIIPLFGIMFVYILVPLHGASGAALAYTLSAFIAFAYGYAMWKRKSNVSSKVTNDFVGKDLLLCSTPLLGAIILQQLVLAIPIITLGIYSDSAEVGYYSTAYRTAALVGLVLIAANSIIAPKFAVLFRNNDMRNLEDVAQKSALLITGMATPAIIAFIVFPQWVMGIFGKEFEAAWVMLLIIAAGQFINVVTGSVGFLLTMTGHEKSFLSANAWAVALCLVLSIILIPIYSGLGAAVAAALSMATINLLRVNFVIKNIGIIPIPFFGKITEGDKK